MRAGSCFVLLACACTTPAATLVAPADMASVTTLSPLSQPFFTPRYRSPLTTWHPVGNVCIDSAAPALAALRFAELAARAQLRVVSPDDSCTWRYAFASTAPELDAGASAAWSAAGSSGERFAVTTALADGQLVTRIYAPFARGATYAVDAAFGQVSVASPSQALFVPSSTIVDWPALATRGVAEGFYGPPFSDLDRQSVIFWMREARENTYVYAPQNDDYAHIAWYEPYPDDNLTALAHASLAATMAGIDFVWVVRPGQGQFYPSAQPIRYANDDDFATLTAKIEQLRGAGVRRFGIFFDDNYRELLDPTDIATFATLVDAQAYLVNRLDDYLVALDPDTRLLVIGTSYSKLSDDWQSYSEAFGPALHANVDLLWGGNETYNQTIDATDVAPAVVALGRTPIIWDNWPRYVTPLEGRSTDLPTQAIGLISNAVVCSWQGLPVSDFTQILGTAAAYTWNPDDYNGYFAIGDWRTLQSALVSTPR